MLICLLSERGYDATTLAQLVNDQCGSLGVSGISPALFLDSRVVACEDGVYSRYPIPRSLTGVHPCRLTSRSSSMMCSVIRRCVSCAGLMVSSVPRVSLNM